MLGPVYKYNIPRIKMASEYMQKKVKKKKKKEIADDFSIAMI